MLRFLLPKRYSLYTYSVLAGLLLCTTGTAQKGFSVKNEPGKKQVGIYFGGQLLTAYCYYDSSRKPILFPVNTVDGITVTRSYPFQRVPGERTDHPHHTGIWLNYESVNGLDFWNNSTVIPPERRNRYGTIIHQSILSEKSSRTKARLVTTADWVTPDQRILLNERSAFRFTVKGSDFIIDRVTTLSATDTTVLFKDVKDGLLAIRVARELELPSKENSQYVDATGGFTRTPPDSNRVTGMYYSSEGLKGDSVWGKQAEWVALTGTKEGKTVSIGIIDHPLNPGYPAYWHARGYGLFAVNPLGRKVFSGGKEELNLSLAPGQSTTFRYRVIIRSGAPLSERDMARFIREFQNKGR